MTTSTGAWRALASGRPDLAAATFRYDLVAGAWTWSDALFVLHGYAPRAVPVTTELVLAHQAAGNGPADVAELHERLGEGQWQVRRSRVVRLDGEEVEVQTLLWGERDGRGQVVAVQGVVLPAVPSVVRLPEERRPGVGSR